MPSHYRALQAVSVPPDKLDHQHQYVYLSLMCLLTYLPQNIQDQLHPFFPTLVFFWVDFYALNVSTYIQATLICHITVYYACTMLKF